MTRTPDPIITNDAIEWSWGALLTASPPGAALADLTASTGRFLYVPPSISRLTAIVANFRTGLRCRTERYCRRGSRLRQVAEPALRDDSAGLQAVGSGA